MKKIAKWLLIKAINVAALPLFLFTRPANWQWYRKLVGGTWTRWYIETTVSNIWFQGTVRPGTARGTPTIETY